VISCIGGLLRRRTAAFVSSGAANNYLFDLGFGEPGGWVPYVSPHSTAPGRPCRYLAVSAKQPFCKHHLRDGSTEHTCELLLARRPNFDTPKESSMSSTSSSRAAPTTKCPNTAPASSPTSPKPSSTRSVPWPTSRSSKRSRKQQPSVSSEALTALLTGAKPPDGKGSGVLAGALRGSGQAEASISGRKAG
jgi:hypothetical protein